jgi:3'-phosphoadenosine 5'-phosphosulfate sulfotransferase (PAPS reductase)/FAD synthetase
MDEKAVRHVLGISGGKDSAALAIYMRDKVPQMEYFFTDTGAELPEVYDYLDKLEAYLGKPIRRLMPNGDFDHLLKMYNNFLPSPNTRWCTREMKIRPFEDWIGTDEAITYVAIRADEDREGYKSTKPNITPKFPFKEDGLKRTDIERILARSGIGYPKYYEWRSRSGCYFCFFQRKGEWVGLAERHPDLFEKAKSYEKIDSSSNERFTWSQGETLEELIKRAKQLAAPRFINKSHSQTHIATWQEVLASDAEEEDASCVICSL